MALINGGTVSLDGQPRDQHERAYLPTPGSSTELRPSQPIPVEFVSPMMLNYNDGLSLDSSASHTFSQHDPAGLDMDMVNYAAMTHTHFGNRNGFPDSSPFVGNGSTRAHEHYFTRRGTASAPAHIAFGDPYQQSHNLHMGAMNPMTEPSSPMHSDLDFDISPLTSPWLGAKMTGSGGSNGRVQAYGHQHHSQNHHHQNQQGLHPPVQAGTKRAASPSMADIDVDVVFPGNTGEAGRSRKRQASISQSPNTMRPTVSPVTRPVNSNTSSSRSGSRSMNSTPLLRGTNPSSRTRRGSVVMGSPLTMAMGANGMNAGRRASQICRILWVRRMLVLRSEGWESTAMVITRRIAVTVEMRIPDTDLLVIPLRPWISRCRCLLLPLLLLHSAVMEQIHRLWSR
ncbi:hypothetical protein BDP27DRAFT_609308 [Rhodocollybia butyracea]|uniref:Uncharacterized protein n=1 Tax=Rhodocollybia butyracea TaxID=206335 RepID=A0A9P5UGF9_9AGAR|nr:hypothetical protein BDP27DRAFT_609308 [Rhodocollybia butyracea]